MILEETIKQASKILKSHNIHSHELDAQIILSDIMGIKREFLITNNEINISEKVIEKYDNAIKRRIKREPVAYIIGKKEFWSQNFRVNHSTLIPRPESELLIYKLVNYFKNRRIKLMSTGFEGQVESHKHTFAVADIGDFDLDEDRSIGSSIEFALKGAGIDAVVDVEEMNASVFYVYCKENEATIREAIESEGIDLEE